MTGQGETSSTESLNGAIALLYQTFASYQIGDDFSGCSCCVSPKDCQRLGTTPLPQLTYDDLERYARKAISTWGEAHHLKHFLPRLLELSIEHRDDFLDLAVVYGKIGRADFESWPRVEQDCVSNFFDKYWEYQLSIPMEEQSDAIDSVLCAIGNALSSVQHLLDFWLTTSTRNADRHLVVFLTQNFEAVKVPGEKLWNSFWDVSSQSYNEVLNWIQSDQVRDRFLGASEYFDIQWIIEADYYDFLWLREELLNRKSR